MDRTPRLPNCDSAPRWIKPRRYSDLSLCNRPGGSTWHTYPRISPDRVIDGDTIDVTGSGGGKPQRVRVLGINTPEVAHQGQSAQCGGDEASKQLEKLLPKGTEVELIGDSRSDDEDRYGRLLRYVETPNDSTDVGAQLIADGYAYAWKPASAPRPDRWDDYEAATNEAQEAQGGSWETCPDFTASKGSR
ncbi:MAG: thermonuclease family protein [Brachybacterium sp.]|uniref:thermonuclease family protein n=1 Tax=Brachybacterium TaxID=43668 RepID=UPI000DF45082|nr:thermonuclease family protein [Brachybacterium alimentarium]